MQDIEHKASQIRLVIFDVDGVLTDGSLFIGDDGQEYKAFNSKDGLGMSLLQQSGVEIAIITARSSEVVKIRMQTLGVKHVFQGRRNKNSAYEELKLETGFTDTQIAYVGDDLIDLPVMRRVGLAIAVKDAHPLVTQHAHWQTPSTGGRGAARDVSEMIMLAQNTFESSMTAFFS